MPYDGLQLHSTVKAEGILELSLGRVEAPDPGPDDVVVQVQATPINPSDLGLLFGPADMSTAKASGTVDQPVVTAQIPEALMGSVAGRVGQALPVGNEGAGKVIATGDSEFAKALLGKTVGAVGGAMYSQYRTINARQCLPLGDDTTAAEGASCFVNPLTALGMVETMRAEGHTALVHTAAASNLGQMLNKLCIAEGIALVNIVRRDEQAAILHALGAKIIINSSVDSFRSDLTEALKTTDATIAFDATGGGKLASQILGCMEAAQSAKEGVSGGYGSARHKQVYIYGGLDRSPTLFDRSFGMAWGVGGWLLTPFLQKIGFEAGQKLRDRVAAEIKTTFASSYGREVSLTEALSLEAIADYGRQATGAKTLINPSKDA